MVKGHGLPMPFVTYRTLVATRDVAVLGAFSIEFDAKKRSMFCAV
jgi:hypothetical protein